MASGVQGRIGQHRYADEFQAIQNTSGNITPAAPPARLTALVYVKPEFIGLIAAAGYNAVIGTNQGAHRTADTPVSRVRFLPDTIVTFKCSCRGFHDIRRGFEEPLAKYPQLNCIYRAYGGALAAKGAFLLIP
jgi:hypothetical protein